MTTLTININSNAYKASLVPLPASPVLTAKQARMEELERNLREAFGETDVSAYPPWPTTSAKPVVLEVEDLSQCVYCECLTDVLYEREGDGLCQDCFETPEEDSWRAAVLADPKRHWLTDVGFKNYALKKADAEPTITEQGYFRYKLGSITYWGKRTTDGEVVVCHDYVSDTERGLLVGYHFVNDDRWLGSAVAQCHPSMLCVPV